jgi:transportin-3
LLTDLQVLQIDNPNLKKFLFDVLETFPDELLDKEALFIDETRKKQITLFVKERIFNLIIQMLIQLWDTEKQASRYHVLRSFRKWLSFGKKELSEEEVILFFLTKKGNYFFDAYRELHYPLGRLRQRDC